MAFQIARQFLERCMRASNWLAWGLLLLPVLLGVLYVHWYGVNVVWEDQGDGMLPILQKWYAGSLTLADIWRQHNEHRHFLPRLIMMGLAPLTHWNTVAEMYVIQFILALSAAVNLRALARSLPYRSVWMWLPIPWIALTFRQSQNLLFGWQIGFTLVILAACASFMALAALQNGRGVRWKMTLAIALAAIATVTAAQGLIVWVAGLIPLLLQAHPRARRLYLLSAWTVAAIAMWVLYFWGYQKPAAHPPFMFSLNYLSTFLGASLFPSVVPACIAGAMILASCAVALFLTVRQRKWADYSYWITLIAFGLLVAGQVTLGRSGFGVGQAMSSRYATISCLILIGAYGILANEFAVSTHRLIAACWGFFTGFVVLGIAWALVDGLDTGRQMRQEMEYQAFVFVTSDSQPDAVVQRGAGPRAPEMREGLKFLRERHWNVFDDADLAQRYAVPPADTPVVNTSPKIQIDGFGRDKATGIVVANGWIVTPDADDTVGGVFIEVDGTLYPAFYGVQRDDVAAVLKNDRLRFSGFLRAFPPDAFQGDGQHRVTFKVLTKDRKIWYAFTVIGAS